MGRLKKLQNSIKYSLLLGLIKAILVVVKIFPWKWTSFFCAQLGLCAFYLLKKERTKTIRNLTIAFGESKTTIDIRRMAKSVFTNLGRGAAEVLIKLEIEDKETYFSNVEVVGKERAEKAYERGKGIISIVPHLGCWEALPKAYTMLDFKAGAVVKSLKNERLNDWLLEKRQFKGLRVFQRGSSYKTILNFLKQNNSLGMLIDQDTSVKGVFVDFYNKPAYTPIGAAMLALDSDATVFTTSYIRTEDNKYKFIFGEALEVTRTGDRKEDLRVNTERFHQAVEKQIMQYPDQWVWMHERWKTTPEMIEAKELEKQELRQRRKEERLRNTT